MTNQFFHFFFLKKEQLYTKLKYSRVPQYDIVSGSVAAFFAGFLGFLICEKFGFELLDSGDFLMLILYLLIGFFVSRVYFFLSLFSKPFLYTMMWYFCKVWLKK